MEYTNFPNEIKLQILQNLDPTDIYNFYISSRHSSNGDYILQLITSGLILKTYIDRLQILDLAIKDNEYLLVDTLLHLINVTPDVLLIDGITNGYNNIISYILNRKKIDDFDAALEESARVGNLMLVELFFQEDISDYQSPLIAASANGHLNIVEYFYNSGMRKFTKALEAAVIRNQFEIVKFIVQKFYDDFLIRSKTLSHNNVVMDSTSVHAHLSGAIKLATEYNRMEIYNYIFPYAVKTRSYGFANENNTVIILGAALEGAVKGGNIGLTQSVIQQGANNFDTALSIAAETHNDYLINYFLQLDDIDVNHGLWGAVTGGHKDLITFFRNQGANGFLDALYVASTTGNVDIFDFVLQRIDPNELNDLNDQETIDGLLTNAIKSGNIDILVKLSELAALRSLEFKINTVLKYGALYGKLTCVVFALQHNANNLNEALIEAVAHQGHFDVVKYLVENGANSLHYPFLLAARFGHLKILKYLVQNGEDLSILSKYNVEDPFVLKYMLRNGIMLNNNHGHPLRPLPYQNK